MTRTVRYLLAAAALAASAQAEVSVDRDSTGIVTPYFQPAASGPWSRVRSTTSAADLLNGSGDARGDSWPEVVANAGTARPDVAWSTGGADPEIRFASHDGSSWGTPRNLSNHPGADTLPVLATDRAGNRFIAWARARNSRYSVHFVALDGGTGQTSVVELSTRHRDARKPSMGVLASDAIAVAYEEAGQGNESGLFIAIDNLDITRRPGGWVSCAGEDSIDLARVTTIQTHQSSSGAVLDVRVHVEGDDAWVTWIDQAGSLGWVELFGMSTSQPAYEPFVVAEGPDAARRRVRELAVDP